MIGDVGKEHLAGAHLNSRPAATSRPQRSPGLSMTSASSRRNILTKATKYFGMMFKSQKASSKPVQLGAYAFALAVSASRVTARRHFPSDIVVRGAFGYLTGDT
jgi:hypothetical protein